MHLPVLQQELIQYLQPKSNENFVDCTFGEGGHTKIILQKTSPGGKVLAIEWDPDLYQKGKVLEKIFQERLILKQGNFNNLKQIVEKERFGPIHGVIFDLGMSSWHLEESGRGFSFKRDEPLIMRYDKDFTKLCAIDVINNFSEKELTKILKEYGQERFAKSIAREIVKERKSSRIETTLHLVRVIERAVPKWYQTRKIHFATKTFMALRVFVNQELENLKKALPQALEILERGGKIAVISFHSLEDKIVKNFFREKERLKEVEILTKKPVRPTQEEILKNHRARSAKLRVLKKL